ncbi:MAG: tetratricopeptide repeat protein [Deltaproteobacteria bacterium]|nr:tetratricopeptide repeat protein [Deltaproteobacteria bacterium]
MVAISWIKREVSKNFGPSDLVQGVDLDKDGVVEDCERITIDKYDNTSEWEKFLDSNKSTLGKMGYFKHYFDHQKRFKLDNPIHDVLSVDMEGMSSEEIDSVYSIIGKIVAEIKLKLTGTTLPAKFRLMRAYQIIQSLGYKIVKKAAPLFFQNVLNKKIDCDSSVLLVLVAGSEMEPPWPLSVVRTPAHVFLRWDNGHGESFNIDRGVIKTDEDYIRTYRISEQSLRNGVYMNSSSSSDKSDRANLYETLISFTYNNRGSAKFEKGDYADALGDYIEATEIDSKNVQAFNNAGLAEAALGNHHQALGYYWWALELDPNYAKAYNNLGVSLFKLGRPEVAIAQYTKALELNPKYIIALRNRADAFMRMGDVESATKDRLRVAELEALQGSP